MYVQTNIHTKHANQQSKNDLNGARNQFLVSLTSTPSFHNHFLSLCTVFLCVCSQSDFFLPVCLFTGLRKNAYALFVPVNSAVLTWGEKIGFFGCVLYTLHYVVRFGIMDWHEKKNVTF